MNKTQLVDSISEKTGFSKAQAHDALEATLEAISSVLIDGESVSLVGFGTFKVSHRSPRTGRNPRTGEPVEIKASNIPSFTAGKTLKEAVNK